MVVTSPAPDPSWPRDQTSQPAPAAETGYEPATLAETRDGASLDLGLMRATIQDGVLMVLGPDDDPVPPQAFGAAAAEQPHARVQFAAGPPIEAGRIAAVLDAQMGGRLGSGQGGDEAWIKSMLGIGPRPEAATADDLLAEGCEVEVIALGREIMITSPAGGTFLIAEARSTIPASIRLHGPDAEPMALGDLVAGLLGRAQGDGADQLHARRDEVSFPDCRTWLEEDALTLDLPDIGPVYLVRSDPADQGPSVSVFMPDGDTATIDDLLAALSRPLTSPDAEALACEEADPIIAGPSPAGEAAPDAEPLVDRTDPIIAEPSPAGEAADHAAAWVDRAVPIIAEPATAGEAPPDAAALVARADPTMARPASVGAPVGATMSGEPAPGSPREVPLPIGLPNAFAATPQDVALVVIHGLPHGASLSAGVATGDGSWMLSPRDLPGLSVNPPPGLTLDLALEVVAIAVRNREGELARASTSAQVPLRAAPGGRVRVPIPLRVDPQILSAQEAAPDALVVRDLPPQATLSVGAYDPAIDGWVLLPRQLGELTVTPGAGQTADFTLTLLGISLSEGRPRSHLLGRIPIRVG
jgi:hypothetical protein